MQIKSCYNQLEQFFGIFLLLTDGAIVCIIENFQAKKMKKILPAWSIAFSWNLNKKWNRSF